MNLRHVLMIGLIGLCLLCSCSDDNGFVGEISTPPQGAKDTPDSPTETESTLADPSILEAPETSITQGSFTVWVMPEDPAPGEDYQLFIQAKYPAATTSLNRDDLTGCLIGTDEYLHRIVKSTDIPDEPAPLLLDEEFDGSFELNCETPVDQLPVAFLLFVQSNESFTVEENVATLMIAVPGGEAEVRDTITVNSDILDETQEITIEF